MTTETLTATDAIFIAQEMAAASQRYAASAENLRRMEPAPGQFANAISGQRQMADICDKIARKAKVLRGFTDAELEEEVA